MWHSYQFCTWTIHWMTICDNPRVQLRMLRAWHPKPWLTKVCASASCKILNLRFNNWPQNRSTEKRQGDIARPCSQGLIASPWDLTTKKRRSIHTLLWGLGTFLVGKYDGSWVLIDLGLEQRQHWTLWNKAWHMPKMLRWKWIHVPGSYGCEANVWAYIYSPTICNAWNCIHSSRCWFLNDTATTAKFWPIDIFLTLLQGFAKLCRIAATTWYHIRLRSAPKMPNIFLKGLVGGPRGGNFDEFWEYSLVISSTPQASLPSAESPSCDHFARYRLRSDKKTSPNEQTMCVNFDLNCLQIDNAEKRTNEGNHFFML